MMNFEQPRKQQEARNAGVLLCLEMRRWTSFLSRLVTCFNCKFPGDGGLITNTLLQHTQARRETFGRPGLLFFLHLGYSFCLL